MTKLLKVTCKILGENYWCFDRANDYEANNDNWGCVKDFVGDRYYTSEEEADAFERTDKEILADTFGNDFCDNRVVFSREWDYVDETEIPKGMINTSVFDDYED